MAEPTEEEIKVGQQGILEIFPDVRPSTARAHALLALRSFLKAKEPKRHETQLAQAMREMGDDAETNG